MAKQRVGGALGGVSFITNANADFNRWSLNVSTNVEDDTPYGGTTAAVLASTHTASGVLDYGLAAGGFLYANDTNSMPGFNSLNSTNAFGASGAAVTLTAKTGCTFAGTFVLSGGAIDHHVRAGAVPVSYTGINNGVVTETWATS